uniref:Leukocyte associated immunoglobulin like receptor 1 n=1 Tax=Homo sapiens TaxID=9606 RepID=F2Z3B9_HUMAN
MSPHPTALLGLVLCLAQTIHTQEVDAEILLCFPPRRSAQTLHLG